ncbi:hypothetical protein, partial [Microseira wollei]|uniref:hypothetical protein n=1 Tax=Microseira wollei TaxID=467598 RepID=UPI001CFDAA8E
TFPSGCRPIPSINFQLTGHGILQSLGKIKIYPGRATTRSQDLPTMNLSPKFLLCRKPISGRNLISGGMGKVRRGELNNRRGE